MQQRRRTLTAKADNKTAAVAQFNNPFIRSFQPITRQPFIIRRLGANANASQGRSENIRDLQVPFTASTILIKVGRLAITGGVECFDVKWRLRLSTPALKLTRVMVSHQRGRQVSLRGTIAGQTECAPLAMT